MYTMPDEESLLNNNHPKGYDTEYARPGILSNSTVTNTRRNGR